MTPKEYLSQYRELASKIRRDTERLRQMEASIGGTGVNLSGMPSGSGISKPTEIEATHLADIRIRLEQEILEARLKQQEISDAINRVDGAIYKDVLFARYVLDLSWSDVTEWVSKGRSRPYDERHVRGRLHGEALEKFRNV